MQPVVFVVHAGEDENFPLLTELKQRAAQVWGAGQSFFLELAHCENAEDIHQRVQALKAQILQSDTLTDLNELHVVAVCCAHNQVALGRLLQDLSALRGWFCDDFAMVRFSLCVLIYESPLFSARIDRARAFLAEISMAHLSETRRAFAQPILILSDRNERNAIHPRHQTQMVDIVVRVPLIFSRSQVVTDWIAQTRVAGTPLFVTAGISPQPDENTDVSFANSMTPEAVTSYLIGVPFTHVSIFQLRKLTLAQAEAALFGDAMLHAFKRLCHHADDTPTQNATLFAHRVKAWRVRNVIRQIAHAYTLQYRLTQRDDTAHYHAPSHSNTSSVNPPALLLSFIRRDGWPEETLTLTQGSRALLRIASGFPAESLTLMNYTKRDNPCGLANPDI